MRGSTVAEFRVASAGTPKHHGWLQVGGRQIRCALGRSGITVRKREGDGATPAGSWPLRYVCYRPDRTRPPMTQVPVYALSPNDGWCDAPHDEFYNRPVRLPFASGAERLWRDDHLYDVLVILGHNDRPVETARGSAIFFHLAKPNFAATEGCVAVQLSDMLQILEQATTNTHLMISA